MALRHVNYVLTPKLLDAAKPRERPYSLTDGGGLHVEVLPGGSKVWRFKYHRDGRREKVTLGRHPALGIKAARDRHAQLREQLEAGDSPAKVKRREVAARRVQTSAPTFRAFAQRWIDETLFYRSTSYRAQIVRWLDAHVYPAIGDVPLGEVTPAQILAILDKLLDTPTTADRVRVHIQQIYNFAIRKLLVNSNPVLPLRGAVAVPPKKHHRALSESELAAWWCSLEKQGAHATTIMAARLLALTMVRKCELIRSRWTEFDLERAQWDVPAERMKMRRPHRVFLSRQAVSLLRELHRLTGHVQYALPSVFRSEVPMAEVTLNHFFRRLDFGVPEFSPHGLRGTAATLLREHGFGQDVVELLLAHAEKDQTVAAYFHAEHVPERKRAMQFLADQIEVLAVQSQAHHE